MNNEKNIASQSYSYMYIYMLFCGYDVLYSIGLLDLESNE